MKTAKSSLQFLGYEVQNMFFEKTSLGESIDDSGTFEIAPDFRREINDTDDGEYSIELGVRVVPGEHNPNLNITALVVMVGKFKYSGEKMIDNATAILFPYLRATLSMMMVAANESPLILPTMNIVRLFESDKEQQKTVAEKTDPVDTN